MTDMEQTRQQLSNERRHMSAVQRAFGQAARQAENQDRPYFDFFIAAVDYLEFIMARFHAQDQSHMDTLLPFRDSFSEEDCNLYDDLNNTFKTSRLKIDALITANNRLKEVGTSGQKEFEETALVYADFYADTLSKRKHSIRHLVEEHYTPEDYRRHSYITDESIEKEKILFSRVEEVVPTDVTLEVIYE